VPCNSRLKKIVAVLKPDIRTLIEKCNTVRMWVTLLIPKIEDGNNFGVSIQVYFHFGVKFIVPSYVFLCILACTYQSRHLYLSVQK